MHDYLDELLEEAYLEGYYDSIDDYDDYYESRAVGRAFMKAYDDSNKAQQEWYNYANRLKAEGLSREDILKISSRDPRIDNIINLGDKARSFVDSGKMMQPTYQGLKNRSASQIDSDISRAAKAFKERYGIRRGNINHKPISQMSREERNALRQSLLSK